MKRGDVWAWLQSALRYDGADCVPWPFSIGSHGYGDFRREGRHYLAHRWICEQAHGAAPKGSDAAHSCGKRLCCNKQHLRWATRAENHFDKRAHGTHLFGEKHKHTLTEKDVSYIRASSAAGVELAEIFGVHANTIYAVRKERSWKHLL